MSVSIENKVQHICDRAGFLLARKVLSLSCGITALSANKFKEKFASRAVREPGVVADVDAFWNNLVMGGSRLVQVNRVSDEILGQIEAAITAIPIQSEGAFAESYPYPVALKVLREMPSEFALMESDEHEISDDHSVNVAVFCSKAFYTVTEDVPREHLNEEGVELWENALEMKYKTRKVTQCYDLVITDRSRGLVIFAADMSVLPIKEADGQLQRLLAYFRTGLPIDPEFDRAANLFPAIHEMYEREDGLIALIEFVTSDGNKSGLHARSKGECLKLDSYHQGGEANAGLLPKFKLGKQWQMRSQEDLVTFPGIELLGRRQMVEAAGFPLKQVKTVECISLKDTCFVVNKVLESLPEPEAND